MLDKPIKIIKRQNQKTIRVRAFFDHYQVSAPKRLSKRKLEAFIRENIKAIQDLPKTLNIKERLYPSDHLTLFNCKKPLKVIKGKKDKLTLLEDAYLFETKRKTPHTIAKALESEIDRLLKIELEQLHLVYRKKHPKLCNFNVLFKTRYMKSRFGSANPVTKTIMINRAFIHYKKEYLAYIYAHEIIHFTHQNHSQQFYKSLYEIYPDYKTMRTLLRKEHFAYTSVFNSRS